MKQEIVHTALENLQATGGIHAKWVTKGPLDGRIILPMGNGKNTFITEIKRELRQHQLAQIKAYHRAHKHFMVVAETIFPKIKKQLRDLGIAYLEANGNIFVRTDTAYLFIDTNKDPKIRKEKSNRAFTKTGLKVLFHFLMDPNLINRTHREIAEWTEVGLGNIPQIINGLKETGYLLALNRKNYIWEDRKELLDRWINDYATELRPKTVKGTYRIPNDWKDMVFNEGITVWGGEPAADLLTNYLRPEKFLLHTLENNIDLIKNYRLVPDKQGKLEVLEMFWKNREKKPTAPPIIIYAELMIEGGKRNEEVAGKIYKKYIEPNL